MKESSVTDATTIFYSPEDSLFIPNRGYRVQDAFAPYGGVEATIDQCGRCLANIDPEDHPNKRLAACHGELKVVADHPLFAPVVQQAIKNRELQDAVAERFLKTNPPWYGFWMQSPIGRPEAEVLLPILDEALANYQYPVEGEEDFMEALSLVKAWGLIFMHVTLLPPEAQDTSGYYGYHCPSCKAPTPDVVLRPQRPGLIRQFPTIECPVCGFTYSPLETRGQYQPPPPEVKDELLEEQLGTEEYWEFVYRYLLSMSEPEERAKQYCRWERERREENPKTWEQQPATPFGPDDVPYHGPPCSDCCEYLPSPQAKRCERCGAEQE